MSSSLTWCIIYLCTRYFRIIGLFNFQCKLISYVKIQREGQPIKSLIFLRSHQLCSELQWRNRSARGTYTTVTCTKTCRGCEFEPHLEQALALLNIVKYLDFHCKVMHFGICWYEQVPTDLQIYSLFKTTKRILKYNIVWFNAIWQRCNPRVGNHNQRVVSTFFNEHFCFCWRQSMVT